MEFRKKYASHALETEDAPFPREGEECWVITFKEIRAYPRPVPQADCSDIKTSTSRKPLSEWIITGATPIRPPDARHVVEAIRHKAELAEAPTHEELVNELLELGSTLNFIVRKEEYTPDHVYRLDVTWREHEGHRPLKAFEVELSGEVDKALARLAHALDVWGCEQLWLIISDIESEKRVKKLVEPRLTGSFAKLRGRVRILSWKQLHNLYISIKKWQTLIRQLSER